jgi:hypothetical protein
MVSLLGVLLVILLVVKRFILSLITWHNVLFYYYVYINNDAYNISISLYMCVCMCVYIDTPEHCEVDSCNEHVGQGGGWPHLHGDPFGPTCLYSAANYSSDVIHPPLIGMFMIIFHSFLSIYFYSFLFFLSL